MEHRTKISKNPELFNVTPLAPEVIYLQDAVWCSQHQTYVTVAALLQHTFNLWSDAEHILAFHCSATSVLQINTTGI